MDEADRVSFGERSSSKSGPGSTIVPSAPKPLPNEMIKQVDFQNSATRLCKKARSSSSVVSLPDARRSLDIECARTRAQRLLKMTSGMSRGVER